MGLLVRYGAVGELDVGLLVRRGAVGEVWSC